MFVVLLIRHDQREYQVYGNVVYGIEVNRLFQLDEYPGDTVAAGQSTMGNRDALADTRAGHHLELTDPIREYVKNKLARLERHNDRITQVAVILSVEKLIQKAEATVHADGVELFANSEHEDLYAAIDALADKLDRQLIKRKERLRGH